MQALACISIYNSVLQKEKAIKPSPLTLEPEGTRRMRAGLHKHITKEVQSKNATHFFVLYGSSSQNTLRGGGGGGGDFLGLKSEDHTLPRAAATLFRGAAAAKVRDMRHGLEWSYLIYTGGETMLVFQHTSTGCVI